MRRLAREQLRLRVEHDKWHVRLLRRFRGPSEEGKSFSAEKDLAGGEASEGDPAG